MTSPDQHGHHYGIPVPYWHESMPIPFSHDNLGEARPPDHTPADPSHNTVVFGEWHGPTYGKQGPEPFGA